MSVEDLTPNDFDIIAQRDKVIPIDPQLDSLSDLGAKVGEIPVSDINEVIPAVEEIMNDDGTISLANYINIIVKQSNALVVTGDGVYGVAIPTGLNGKNLTAALARIYSTGSGGTTTIQVRRRRANVSADMLSTRITVSYNEYYAADGVINTSNDDVATGDMIFVDVDTVASTHWGLSVVLTFE